ncbi:hypothetical protein SGM_0869 [Streptomyces griseoaurantiacus M045]|uniref:Uncharacterized protein n=1 Tax=Streptomyces griseoaurantiacus M045 TaxID=996637 RepID=F3NCK5_9ACTN|nr:hypothetical protein SGM_0869 [Streptomyces griseoaurantiacus M045]
MLGRRGCAVAESSGRHGQEGAPVVAVWNAERRWGSGFFRGRRRCGSGVFKSTGPRATSVTATESGRSRRPRERAARGSRGAFRGRMPGSSPVAARGLRALSGPARKAAGGSSRCRRSVRSVRFRPVFGHYD